MAVNKVFRHNGINYEIDETYIKGRWVFSLHSEGVPIVHDTIDTAISMSTEQIQEFDQRHKPGAFYQYAHDQLVKVVTEIIPKAEEIKKVVDKSVVNLKDSKE